MADKQAKLGLWDRIRAKRERGEKPAQPGDKDYPDSKNWKRVTSISRKKQAGSPAWQRSAGKNPEGGLNAKGRASYNKATGGNLKAPVTESDPKGDRAKRQNSFCSRMCGMKRKNTGSDAKKDPDSRINKSLRKWNCKCSAAREFGQKMAGIGSTVGVLGGLITGDKDNKVNAAMRGGIKGFGFDAGAGLGAGLGMLAGGLADPTGISGRLIGAGLGGIVGGAGGYAVADSAIGPYRTEQEKFEHMLAEREKKLRKKEVKTAQVPQPPAAPAPRQPAQIQPPGFVKTQAARAFAVKLAAALSRPI